MGDKRKMTGKELTDEELQEIADTYGLYTEQDVKNRVSCELLRIGARNEELEKENAELKEVHESDKRSLRLIAEKGADLEKKISILLSCKNCPDNKGGYICQKEYEDKCLAQKIQYIKELKEENAELRDKNKALEQYADLADEKVDEVKSKLTKAKELLGDWIQIAHKNHARCYGFVKDTEQFLAEN